MRILFTKSLKLTKSMVALRIQGGGTGGAVDSHDEMRQTAQS
jgi:hypothetical protein